MALICKKNKDNAEKLWGYINSKGEMVISPQFKIGLYPVKNSFSDGLALVSDGSKYGYIDKSGKYVINPQFDQASMFRNGRAVVIQGSTCGYIDKGGKICINPQFNDADFFYGNLAAVSSSDNKFGYIDKDGKYAINPQFDRALPFYGDITAVKSGDKWGFIDTKGKYVINPQYDDIDLTFENWDYYQVASDFFDKAAITDKILEGTTANSFQGFSANTTYGELKKKFPNLKLDASAWTATTNEPVKINNDATINSMAFVFADNPVAEEKPVYHTVQKYDYWKGNYTAQEVDHYEPVANDNAKVKAMGFKLSLSTVKAINKSAELYKAIGEKLTGMAGFESNTFPINQYNAPTLTNNNFQSSGTLIIRAIVPQISFLGLFFKAKL